MGTKYYKDLRTSKIDTILLLGHANENPFWIYSNPDGNTAADTVINIFFMGKLSQKARDYMVLLGCNMGTGNFSANLSQRTIILEW